MSGPDEVMIADAGMGVPAPASATASDEECKEA